jgi:hypothetical protein
MKILKKNRGSAFAEANPKTFARKRRPQKVQGPSTCGSETKTYFKKKKKCGCSTTVSRVEVTKNVERLKTSQGASS